MNRHNGRAMLNGTAAGEAGERVLVYRVEPVDELEPLPEREFLSPIQRAALRALAGYDGRSYEEIGAELGVTGAAVNLAAQKMAKRIDYRTERHGRKDAQSKAHTGKKKRPARISPDRAPLAMNHSLTAKPGATHQ